MIRIIERMPLGIKMVLVTAIVEILALICMSSCQEYDAGFDESTIATSAHLRRYAKEFHEEFPNYVPRETTRSVLPGMSSSPAYFIMEDLGAHDFSTSGLKNDFDFNDLILHFDGEEWWIDSYMGTLKIEMEFTYSGQHVHWNLDEITDHMLGEHIKLPPYKFGEREVKATTACLGKTFTKTRKGARYVFTCVKCGKTYTTKPEACSGMVEETHKEDVTTNSLGWGLMDLVQINVFYDDDNYVTFSGEQSWGSGSHYPNIFLVYEDEFERCAEGQSIKGTALGEKLHLH